MLFFFTFFAITDFLCYFACRLTKQGRKKAMKRLFRRVINLYVDGFRSMTVGRSLWAIIIIKLFIMFAVLKLFFFPDLLSENYDSDAERAEAVATELTQR